MSVDLKISSADNKICYFKIIVFLHNDFFFCLLLSVVNKLF